MKCHNKSIMSQGCHKTKRRNASTTCLFKEIVYIQSLSYINLLTSNTKTYILPEIKHRHPSLLSRRFLETFSCSSEDELYCKILLKPYQQSLRSMSLSLLEQCSLSSIFILFFVFTFDKWVNIPFFPEK